VIQGRLISFTTEDELAQPHIQEFPVFDFTKGAVLHMVQDVIFVSTPWFHPCLSCGTFEIPGTNKSCNVKAGNHLHIGQSWGHWAVTKKEGVDAI
jgi:hypothetical protein